MRRAGRPGVGGGVVDAGLAAVAAAADQEPAVGQHRGAGAEHVVPGLGHRPRASPLRWPGRRSRSGSEPFAPPKSVGQVRRPGQELAVGQLRRRPGNQREADRRPPQPASSGSAAPREQVDLGGVAPRAAPARLGERGQPHVPGGPGREGNGLLGGVVRECAGRHRATPGGAVGGDVDLVLADVAVAAWRPAGAGRSSPATVSGRMHVDGQRVRQRVGRADPTGVPEACGAAVDRVDRRIAGPQSPGCPPSPSSRPGAAPGQAAEQVDLGGVAPRAAPARLGERGQPHVADRAGRERDGLLGGVVGERGRRPPGCPRWRRRWRRGSRYWPMLPLRPLAAGRGR